MQNVISISPEETEPLEVPIDLATAAHNLGLRQVKAWVPDNPRKVRSGGAERTKRARERAEQKGKKQVSVTLPVDEHERIKTFAARVNAGEPPGQVWADLSHFPDQAATPRSQPTGLAKIQGWRRWLLRWLLPPELRSLLE